MGGLPPEWARSPLADLLHLMVPHLSKLGSPQKFHWMRAHGTCEQAVEHGVPALAWMGNDLADQAAKSRASSLAPPNNLCEDRAKHATMHLQACKLIAAVQEAHMYAVRQTATTNTPSYRPSLARKTKRSLPPLAPRSDKRRRAGDGNVNEAGASATEGHHGAPDLSILITCSTKLPNSSQNGNSAPFCGAALAMGEKASAL